MENKKINVTIQRSLIKSITYRILIIISDIIVIYLLTKRIEMVIAFTVFSNLSATILYLIHERIWNKVEWGRINSF